MKDFEPRTTRTCVYSQVGQVIHVRSLGGVEIQAVDAWEHVRVMMELTGGVPAPLLVDLTAPTLRPATPEARAIYAMPHMLQFTGRCALLIRSPVSRLIGNLFLLFNRPPYPTKLFTSEAEAFAWPEETDAARVA